EKGLAVAAEDLGHRHAGRALDLLVGIEEGDTERPGERGPHRGLSRAHHADEHDRLPQHAGSQLGPVSLRAAGGKSSPGPRTFCPQWRELAANAIYKCTRGAAPATGTGRKQQEDGRTTCCAFSRSSSFSRSWASPVSPAMPISAT